MRATGGSDAAATASILKSNDRLAASLTPVHAAWSRGASAVLPELRRAMEGGLGQQKAWEHVISKLKFDANDSLALAKFNKWAKKEAPTLYKKMPAP